MMLNHVHCECLYIYIPDTQTLDPKGWGDRGGQAFVALLGVYAGLPRPYVRLCIYLMLI